MAHKGRAAPRKVRPEHHEFRDSSRIDAAWYDPAKKTVTALFPDGVQWVYEGVDRKTWTKFVQAGSAGKFLAEHLDSHPNHAL